MSKDKLTPTGGAEPALGTLHQDAKGVITLRLARDRFAELIYGFLGAKETLKAEFEWDFTAHLADLLQFHYLLTQKVEKEQFITLLLMTATLEYDNRTSRTLNTSSAFERYAEHLDVGVRSALLTWTLTVQAPEDQAIQQQKVSLSFDTTGGSARNGSIKIKIEHTNALWATEVQRLFGEQVRKLANSYTNAFAILDGLRRLQVFGFMAFVCLVGVIVGAIYVGLKLSERLHPIRLRDEFIFDVAKVLRDHPNDPKVVTQFFILRDLNDGPRSIVAGLAEKGAFAPEYSDVVEKLTSGYYDKDDESHQVGWTLEARIREAKAMRDIAWVWFYGRYAVLYVTLAVACNLYLSIFRRRSILALTAKGERLAKREDQRTSNAMQLCFGVVSSLLAAFIWTYGLSLLWSL